MVVLPSATQSHDWEGSTLVSIKPLPDQDVSMSPGTAAGASWDENIANAPGSNTQFLSSSHSSCRILLAGGSATTRQALAGTLSQLLEVGKGCKCATLSLPTLVLEGDGDPAQGLLKALPGILQR